MQLANKVAVVTGASSGIGAAIAILFAKEGANVVIVGRNMIKLLNVAATCKNNGNTPHIIKADVSDDEQAKRIIKDAVTKFGQIDILVNSAGISKYGSILDGKILEAYDALDKTNMRAIIHLTTLAAPYLIKTKGNIINISSTGSQVTPSIPSFTSYCILKSALEHFTKASAFELSSHGVRVNCIRPGPVKTDIIENSGFPGSWDTFKAMTVLDRVGEPEEIADIAVFLASDRARSVTGSVYTSDNGLLLKSTM